MKIRLLSISMILIMFLSLFPPIPSAAATNDYLIDNGILIKYTGKAANIVIPKGVTTIGPSSFTENGAINKTIISITMPDSVTTIEDGAFQSCTALTKVTLSKNLKSIDRLAFTNCAKLKSIQLPYGLERIETGAFNSNTSLTVPTTVKYLGQGSVDSLSKKKEFVVLGDGILYRYNGKGGNVVIPNNVKIIGERAFLSHFTSGSIKSVTIPGSVKEIWSSAFDTCSNMTRVTLSEGIKTICPSAFSDCTKLTRINIPKSLEDTSLVSFRSKVQLGNHSADFDIRGNGILFKYKGTASNVVIPKGVKIIGYGAFYQNKTMNSVVIPDSVVSIGSSAFSNCGELTQIDIPNSVKSIGSSAFDNCYRLKNIKLPIGLTRIEESTFASCRMERVIIPDKVTSIGENAFNGCISLYEILIPNGVTSIGKYAFSGSIVNGVIIPPSVTHIGKGAFDSKCTTELTIQNGNTRIDELAFYNGFNDKTNITITSPPGGSVQRMAARKKLKFKAYTK